MTRGTARPFRHLIAGIAAVVLLAGVAYLNRASLERTVLAYRVSRSHIFTPPPDAGGTEKIAFFWDFSRLRMDREARLKQLNPSLKPLVKEIQRHQAAGEGMQYSMHIYREIRWRLNFTPDAAVTRSRIADLARSLNQPEEQKEAALQQAEDGSWGLGLDPWYLRLYYSVEDGLGSGAAPQYPLAFLDRINSPEKLHAQLDRDLYNDFTKTHVFNREELDETFSALARLLFGHKQTGNYPFHPQLKDALRQFVLDWQNPQTGCWGQWVLDRQGRVWKMDDMAMTFHVISDLHGDVPHLDLTSRRVLQLDPLEFPAGIRFNGHYENHLNWDVVKIFRYAWPSLDAATRREAGIELSRLLDWCLTNSYQSDGSFRVSDLDDTLGDAFFYGVSFLTDIGYFRRQDRFWTDRDFPQAPAVKARIEERLQSIGLTDPNVKDAYATLRALSNDSPSR